MLVLVLGGYIPGMNEQWYWCLSHQQVEPAGQCRADDRMGPYESPEAAARWKEKFSDRQAQQEQSKDAWDREDEAWDAWPQDGGADGGR